MKRLTKIMITFFCIVSMANAQTSKKVKERAQYIREAISIEEDISVEFAQFEEANRQEYHKMVDKYKHTKQWSKEKKKFSDISDEKAIAILGRMKYKEWKSYLKMQKLLKEEKAMALEMEKYKRTSSDQLYEPAMGALKHHKIPKWAEDAKFGVYGHWGVYSQMGAWDYEKLNWANYYITAYNGVYSTKEKNEQRVMFEKKYGKISEGFGYKDLAKDFKAENWDPAYWADLMQKSGAKYAGICAVHHDGYCMWDSEVTDYCAGKLGPKRDLYGELISEIRKRGMKTIASFHHGRTYKHFKGITDNLKKDPQYANVDLLNEENNNYYWFTGSEERFTKNRLDLTLEFIDKYDPDVLWFDGGGGAFDTEKILARHFNNAIKNGTEVSVHNKGNFGANFGVYSYENGAGRPSYVDWPWEDDTPSAVGWCDWQWDKNIQYKKARDVIVRLADLVARNGGLLLSINPKSDGTLDQGQIDLLLGIGNWLGKYGEAIYGTHPWKIIGEGHLDNLFYTELNPVSGKPSRAIQPNTSLFNEEDVRFTTKDNFLYAIVLGAPSSKNFTIQSLNSKEEVSLENKIQKVELLGSGKVSFKRDGKGLHMVLPKSLPDNNAIVFKISIEGILEVRKNDGKNKIVPMKT
jgi:alpha-L-fucosidase